MRERLRPSSNVFWEETRRRGRKRDHQPGSLGPRTSSLREARATRRPRSARESTMAADDANVPVARRRCRSVARIVAIRRATNAKKAIVTMARDGKRDGAERALMGLFAKHAHRAPKATRATCTRRLRPPRRARARADSSAGKNPRRPSRASRAMGMTTSIGGSTSPLSVSHARATSTPPSVLMRSAEAVAASRPPRVAAPTVAAEADEERSLRHLEPIERHERRDSKHRVGARNHGLVTLDETERLGTDDVQAAERDGCERSRAGHERAFRLAITLTVARPLRTRRCIPSPETTRSSLPSPAQPRDASARLASSARTIGPATMQPRACSTRSSPKRPPSTSVSANVMGSSWQPRPRSPLHLPGLKPEKPPECAPRFVQFARRDHAPRCVSRAWGSCWRSRT